MAGVPLKAEPLTRPLSFGGTWRFKYSAVSWARLGEVVCSTWPHSIPIRKFHTSSLIATLVFAIAQSILMWDEEHYCGVCSERERRSNIFRHSTFDILASRLLPCWFLSRSLDPETVSPRTGGVFTAAVQSSAQQMHRAVWRGPCPLAVMSPCSVPPSLLLFGRQQLGRRARRHTDSVPKWSGAP